MAARDLRFYIEKIFYLLLRFVTAVPYAFYKYILITVATIKFGKEVNFQKDHLDVDKIIKWLDGIFPLPFLKKYGKIFFKTVIARNWILNVIDWLSYISIEVFILFHFHFHLTGINKWLFWILLISLVFNIQIFLKKDIYNNE